ARRMGLARSTVWNRLQQAAKRGLMGTAPVLPGFRISRISTLSRADGSVIHENVQQRPDHEGQFSIPEGHRIKGISALVDGEGNVVQQWFKTREGELAPDAIAEAIREALSDFTPPPASDAPATIPGDIDLANVFV